jgi:hypothetical protein
MPDPTTVNVLRQWHETQLLPGGKTRDVKKIRAMIGDHGPFEWTFDRDASAATITETIRAQKREIEELGRLT